MSILNNLKPENVFRYFEEICQIPHGSFNTKAISDYLVDFAKDHNLEYYQDETDNVIIIKEATEGYENSEPVIIQGHMDMVCEKDASSNIDFEKDGLDLYIDGDFVKAKGTTLGGDDGIAIAYGLAILDDTTLSHPRIELVITTNEEVGLLGANDIDLSMLKGHILLNIDSDVEGHFLTSCAGGLAAEVKLPVSWQTISGTGVAIKLHGLEGGHSGAEIDKEHANAIIETGRILKYLDDRMPLAICAMEGGLKDNAIPREVDAQIVIPTEEVNNCKTYIEEITAILKKEYETQEPSLTVSVDILDEKEYKALSATAMQKVLFYLRNVPNGVQHMSMNIKGLVETSLNAGIMKLEDDTFFVHTSVRSSVGSRKEELVGKLTYLTEFLGGTIDIDGDYPAWEYRSDSAIRGKIAEVYSNMFGEEPIFEAIHAGLECGLLSDKIENMDAVSFGPNNFDIHTPKERLSIESTERVYRFLVELLKSMK